MSENLMDPRQEHASKPPEDDLTLLGVAKKLGRWIVSICGAGAIVLVVLYYFLTFDLIRAARRGNYSAVAVAVAWSTNIVNQRLHGGGTLLYAAAAGDEVEIVEFLFDSGADPNFPTRGGDRPVHAAAREGSARAMKALIDAGADLGVTDKLRDEPLILTAARNGHFDVVRVLLDAGADPNAPSWHQHPWDSEPHAGMRAIEWAAIHGHAEVVKLLVERGAKVMLLDDDHLDTALHTFCNNTPIPKVEVEHYEHWKRNVPAIVDLFVKQLGNVNCPNGLGDTPLHEAAGNLQASSDDIMRHLVKNYPELDVNAIGYSEKTPLHQAMVHPKQLHSVKFLVENCPDLDVNATDEFEHTPLHQGARFGNAAAVKYLLENCPTVNVNATNQWGFTPLNLASAALHKAKQRKNQEKVKAIIEMIERLKAHGGKFGKYRI